MAEDLTNYFKESGIRCKWLHSELDAIERIQIIRELREGAFDALIGVNLLREGLDLPEVALVAILDADKEGFLRSGTSLIQTIGRAARNVNSKVFLYADRVTDSMQYAISETSRRREIQLNYNIKHGITPKSVISAIESGIEQEIAAQKMTTEVAGIPPDETALQVIREKLQEEMLDAASKLDFEKAAKLRDELAKIRGDSVATPQGKPKKRGRGNRP
jgi:excinuclease ABC subunit B